MFDLLPTITNAKPNKTGDGWWVSLPPCSYGCAHSKKVYR